MKDSKIEWCDHTFNPWIGCTKVSPGCANCYAEARDQRFAGGAHWGPGAPRQLTGPANWKQPLKWDEAARQRDLVSYGLAGVKYTRPRVFCASLADWLDDEVPIEWLASLLSLIKETPNLDWLLLTKRPENFARVLQVGCRLESDPKWGELPNDHPAVKLHSWIGDWTILGKAPMNVWIGTTVEDQTRADIRIPALLKIPAKVRFLSCEPLLGPVDLRFPMTEDEEIVPFPLIPPAELPTNSIHWVICGGESGQHARPMHPDWAISLCDQCEAASVPFLFKQWGEWVSAGC